MAYLEECMYAGFVSFSPCQSQNVQKNYANHIQWLGIFQKTVPVSIFFKKKNCIPDSSGEGMHISNNKLHFTNKHNKAQLLKLYRTSSRHCLLAVVQNKLQRCLKTNKQKKAAFTWSNVQKCTIADIITSIYNTASFL